MVIQDVKNKRTKSRYSVFTQTRHKLLLINDYLKNHTADEMRKRVLNIHFLIESGATYMLVSCNNFFNFFFLPFFTAIFFLPLVPCQSSVK